MRVREGFVDHHFVGAARCDEPTASQGEPVEDRLFAVRNRDESPHERLRVAFEVEYGLHDDAELETLYAGDLRDARTEVEGRALHLGEDVPEPIAVVVGVG